MKPRPSGVTGYGEYDMKDDVKVLALPAEKTGLDADILGIVGAVSLGLMLLFAAGFAQATVMHDTSHDQRHAMAFPCH